MASKKKPTARKPASKQPTAGGDPVAVKILSTLPALTSPLRRAFHDSFTDAQCRAWGEKTKASNVIKEAEKWLATLDRALAKNPPVAWSRRRLAYLCELVVLLSDEVDKTADRSGLGALRNTRNAALAVAVNARREVAGLIRAVAGGRAEILSALAKLSPSSEKVPSDVQDALTATIDYAQKLRRTPLLEVLADDVGLTADVLNAAWSALEALNGTTEAALDAAAHDGDAPSVNLIEGRVLREMRLAQQLFAAAREKGVNVPVLLAAPSLAAIFKRDAHEEVSPPAEEPTGDTPKR